MILALYDMLTVLCGQNTTNYQGTGIQFSSDCEVYRDSLDEATKAIYDMARLAIPATEDPTQPYFHQFFEDEGRQMVHSVMRNIARAIQGHDHRVPVSCSDTDFCEANPMAGGYLTRTRERDNDTINLCAHIFDGRRGSLHLAATNDVCRIPPGRADSIASTLMHEMIHVYSIAENTLTRDWAYDLNGCQRLAKGSVRGRYGIVMSAATNANNYVYFAEFTYWSVKLGVAGSCTNLDQSAVKDLLSTGFNNTNLTLSVYDKARNLTDRSPLLDGRANDSALEIIAAGVETEQAQIVTNDGN